MGKNKGKGGKKHKRAASKDQDSTHSRELVMKEELEDYAKIGKAYGQGRFLCECYDGKERLGSVRGKMYKRIFIANGDLVLVSLREFQDKKCDIVHKYKPGEVRTLIDIGEIEAKMEEGDGEEEDSTPGIIFQRTPTVPRIPEAAPQYASPYSTPTAPTDSSDVGWMDGDLDIDSI